MPGLSWYRAAGLTVATCVCALGCSLTSASGGGPPGASHRSQVGDHTASTAASATRIHHVSPITRAGRLKTTYQVTEAARGYCWTTSFLNPQLYRCLQGNLIQDPCWPKAGGGAVFCLVRPWSHRVTRLHLTKRLPATARGRVGLWGLTLASGLNCQVPGGTHDVWQGHDVNYYCPRDWVLLDEPDRSSPAWHILTARYLHRHYHGRGVRTLSDAWRAARL
jgi:hypothetical protein